MAVLISTLVTMISMIFDLVGRLIGAAFQVIFLLASCAPDPNGGWPNDDDDESRWSDRFGNIPEEDPQHSLGYNHVTGMHDCGSDPDGLYGIEPNHHQRPSY